MEKQEEEENLLEPTESVALPQKRKLQLQTLLLIISISFNIFLGFLGLFSITHGQCSISRESYELGFASDLEPAKSEIELVVRSFSGGVELDSEGHLLVDQEGQEYVGIPKPSIDKAWEELLGGLNLDFDKSEVDLGESTFRWPESGFYFSGLDVYHSLHCLNRLRQAIYPDYYVHIFDRPNDPSRVDHIGHCINHIRQSLQCHADLTPMEWKLDGSKVILKTDTPHTCRNFDKIHAWATSHRTQFENIQSWRNATLRIVD
ncbi:hypothetical protein GQX73_g9468 [Xylaria multiplex]|uniref:Uncharacterized protein n=1 Tax=Xylaria multiplex TaxID=323545 RepID=A0A7C8MNN9_9PEZI|nr:hypothetical protein GQX73_g9468 [Xylaria multiplex]